ncbi:hypothetical protein OROMI_017243 [Orobanche minor]
MAMSDNNSCTEMVKYVAALFQKQHLYGSKESGSDNFSMDMENPKEGSGSDNLSMEMENPKEGSGSDSLSTEMENPKEGSGSDSLSTEMENPKEGSGSDNFSMDMENPKEGSGSDNLSMEMENPMDEVEISSDFLYSSESESDPDSEFVGHDTVAVRFKKEELCKDDDEDLKVVWDKKVKEVLASCRLQCELKWDEGEMYATGTRHAPPDLMNKAWTALYLIASGISAQIVEPIMSGKVHCYVLELTKDISKKDYFQAYVSKEKYDTFRRQFDEHNVADILDCYVLYQVGAIVILTKKEGSIIVARMLLARCLFGDVPFPEAVESALCLLRDDASTT